MCSELQAALSQIRRPPGHLSSLPHHLPDLFMFSCGSHLPQEASLTAVWVMLPAQGPVACQNFAFRAAVTTVIGSLLDSLSDLTAGLQAPGGRGECLWGLSLYPTAHAQFSAGFVGRIFVKST